MDLLLVLLCCLHCVLENMNTFWYAGGVTHWIWIQGVQMNIGSVVLPV